MIPTPPGPGPVRPAEVVNREIRELWPHPAVRLSSEQRARYELLVVEWAAATRSEVVKAA
ncbi:hypothetical protein [Streptomyces venezuelae]|uniref:Integrase n=1 Tax=Streptomyces venezuelae TaxID=54571 RepID=A0A5P2BNG2_STRVZ|nr:hypothetical protein [Streptomyces venezuelae]QES31268.1 hypothetical protein DEJ47_04350 [Streptomyces venezuelae]